MSEGDRDPLEAARDLLGRIGSRALRQRVHKVLVLWELGYLREALSEFRVAAEEALRRLVALRAPEALRPELERVLEQGQATRVVERLYRGHDLIPARVALHLLTLFAWGNYASHHQRQGHHARPSDLGVLISLTVDLEEWIASECDGRGSVFAAEGLAWSAHRLAEETARAGLAPEVAQAFLESAGAGVEAAPHRLHAPHLSLELFWRRPPAAAAPAPYRGLRAFEPEDAERFHGRAELRRRLEEQVDTHRLTVVAGASGAGKTSLLRAGLVPALLDLGCGVLSLADYSHAGLAVARAVLAAWPGRPLVLVLDQLERALLADAAPGLWQELLGLALATGSDREGLRVVLGVREDYLGRLLREASELEGGELLGAGDALLLVGPLDRAGTREAAERPLEGSGVRFEEALLDEELVPALLETAGTVPCNLQLVCGRLLAEARRTGQAVLDRALYRRLGGAAQILAGHLDETLASSCYDGERELAWALLRAMTEGDARRWVELGALWQAIQPVAPGEDAVRLHAVLGRLTDDRLVVARGSGPAVTYSLMHDQLARAVGERASASELEQREAQGHLDRALASWADPGRRELLRGRGLAVVLRHWPHLEHTTSSPARALLVASRRGRLVRRLGVGALLAAALLGTVFGLVQLQRAVREAGRATAIADQGVLLRAQLELDRDPTQAVAWLRNLSSEGAGIGVVTLIEEARRRGVAEVLRGRGPFAAVALSPDGRLLAAASERTVRILELAGRRVVAELSGHTDQVSALAFARGGRLLVSASWDGTLRLWDPGSGRALGAIAAGGQPLYALAVAPDGEQAAAAGADGRVHRLRLAERGASGPPLAAHGKAVLALAFSADGRLLASGSLDHRARLWDAVTGEPRGSLEHPQELYAVSLSPDGRLLATAGREEAVRLWETGAARAPAGGEAEGAPARLLSCPGGVLALAFSPDGRALAAAGAEKVVRLFDVDQGEGRGFPLRGHLGLVTGLAFSADGRRLASSSLDHTLRLWDLAARAAGGLRLRGHEGEVQAIAFAAGGRTLFSAGRDGALRRWSTATGGPAGPALTHGQAALALAVSPDGRWLASGGADGRLLLWEPARGAQTPRLLVQASKAIYALAASPDGRGLAAATGDGRVLLWSLPARREGVGALPTGDALPPDDAPPPKALSGPGGALFALAFTPDGRTLLAAGHDRRLHLWDAAAGKLSASLESGHAEPIYALAVAPDGRSAVTASGDATLRLWDLAARRPRATLLGHRHWVLSVAFAPDGRSLASGSSDGTVRLWESSRGRPLGPPLLGHTDWVYAVAFAPDGGTLASASGDRSIWLWQLGDASLPRLRALIDRLTNLEVRLDGRVEVH